VPFHDVAAYQAFKHFLADTRPDFHYINGDFLDCTSLSTFLKDPAESNRTEEELETANLILDELTDASPTTITKFVMGNHCKRLTKRLWETPELMPFVTKGKTPEQVLADALSLGDRNIDWCGYPDGFNHYGFYITHGEAAGLHAAKKELETYGVSGVSGHVHSNKYWEKRGRNGVVQWWSIGGLCKREVGYRPNNGWIQGFGVLEQIVGTDHFTFHPVEIVGGQFIFNRRHYSQDGIFECR
jgi:hypothetical protein